MQYRRIWEVGVLIFINMSNSHSVSLESLRASPRHSPRNSLRRETTLRPELLDHATCIRNVFSSAPKLYPSGRLQTGN